MRIYLIPLFVLLLPLLSGCYQPLYGTKSMAFEPSAGESALNAIFISTIPDEYGQLLRNLLIDRMYASGRPAQPTHRLDVGLSSVEEKLGLQKDATTTRARLTIRSTYNLIDTKTNKPVFSAASRSVVSYNILDDHYATLASKENAYRRGMKEMSDLIVARLLLHLGGGGKTP